MNSRLMENMNQRIMEEQINALEQILKLNSQSVNNFNKQQVKQYLAYSKTLKKWQKQQCKSQIYLLQIRLVQINAQQRIKKLQDQNNKLKEENAQLTIERNQALTERDQARNQLFQQERQKNCLKCWWIQASRIVQIVMLEITVILNLSTNWQKHPLTLSWDAPWFIFIIGVIGIALFIAWIIGKCRHKHTAEQQKKQLNSQALKNKSGPLCPSLQANQNNDLCPIIIKGKMKETMVKQITAIKSQSIRT